MKYKKTRAYDELKEGIRTSKTMQSTPAHSFEEELTLRQPESRHRRADAASSRRPFFTVGRAWMIKFTNTTNRDIGVTQPIDTMHFRACEREKETDERNENHEKSTTATKIPRNCSGESDVSVCVCPCSHTHTAAFVLRPPPHITISTRRHRYGRERTCVIVFVCVYFFVGFRLVLFIPYAQHSTALRWPYEFSNDLFVLSYCSVYSVCQRLCMLSGLFRFYFIRFFTSILCQFCQWKKWIQQINLWTN